MHAAVSKALFEKSIGRWPPDFSHIDQWVFHNVSFPVVDCEFRTEDRTPLRIYMDCSEWNEQPLSVTLKNSHGELLRSLPSARSNIFNAGPHQTTGLPFICMAGTKEFHTHPSHLNEKWDQFRDKPGFDIGDILMKIWHGWLKGKG